MYPLYCDQHTFRCRSPTISSFEFSQDVQSIRIEAQSQRARYKRLRFQLYRHRQKFSASLSVIGGVQNPIFRLDLAATIPSVDDRAIYRLQTQLDNQAELQLLQLSPSAYVQEIQMISLDACLSEVDERNIAQMDLSST